MNAKELSLSKLNANPRMIGMYIYGITIGMDFRDVAKLLMSDVGSVIKELLSNDVFSGREGYNKVNESLFNYFENGAAKMLSKFDKILDSKGNPIPSPLLVFKTKWNAITDYREHGKKINPLRALALFGKSNTHILEKLGFFELLRTAYPSSSTEGVELYNQLIDFILHYMSLLDIIGQNPEVYADIKTLAEGAEEMRILGRILSLNLGIDTNPSGMLNQINIIERAVYNITNDLSDLIDLTLFAFDESYREQKINEYEKVKHSVNILDVPSRIPHFLGYILTLAIASKEVQSSFKFRTSKELSLELSKEIGVWDEEKVIKGILNFVGDYLRKSWMRSKEVRFMIPKGNQAFDKNGNKYTLTEDTLISLGTDYGDATFRMWMENEIIPNIKKGIIKPNSYYAGLSQNPFVMDLGNDLLTNTISRNPSIIYTLPINMLPRNDAERAVFNKYKSAFNNIASLGYQYITNDQENTIPLVDLFTYYAMIANSWKLSEKSLVPILEDFQNTGIIKEFHDFESAMDKSGVSLKRLDIDFLDLLPYIAPFESPYNSYSRYILYRNPSTHKIQLMRRLSREDLELMEGLEDFLENRIKEYEFVNGNVDTNYFPTGTVLKSTHSININVLVEGGSVDVLFEYDLGTGDITAIYVANATFELPELKLIPTIKENGVKKVNVPLLKSIIKNKLNPC